MNRVFLLITNYSKEGEDVFAKDAKKREVHHQADENLCNHFF